MMQVSEKRQDRDREFEFTDRDFDTIRKLVKDLAGISLSDGKRDMVYSRLARRIRHLGLSDFSSYCALIHQEGNQELGDFVNAITTNLTSFFREPHHFEFLKDKAIPNLLRSRQSEHRLRIWSAGCSTGEEPYTLAMVLREAIPNIDRWDVKILATDIRG